MREGSGILIAMSGGVDSSVAACLVKRSGVRCMGATMRLYRNEDLGESSLKPCCSRQGIDDAAEAAFRLDIPYEVADFTEAFRTEVLDKFVRTYAEGGTPNPCIDCNRFLKFDKLLRYAQARGYTELATGHYARTGRDAGGRWLLKKAVDAGKDQSYVLYSLTQEQLAHIRFPLGALTKPQVRRLAAQFGLGNASKPDSQDICFVPDGDYVHFLEQYTGSRCRPGALLDTQGRVLGQHGGAVRYTLGQRRGLGLAAGTPVYVCAKCMAQNTVTVGSEAALYSGGLLAGDMNWVSIPAPDAPLRCTAKIRYRQPEQPATLYPQGDGIRLCFDTPQRAITPGQAVVLYAGELVLGGGTIREALNG